MAASDTEWTRRLVRDEPSIRDILIRTRTIAVLGIKPEFQGFQPAFYVPEYLQSVGFDVIPVPVYYPEVTLILGQPVFRSLRDVPVPIDLVCVFRRPEDLEKHEEEIGVVKPAIVWMQSGISHAPLAERLARQGIGVVQDRCIMVDHRRLCSGSAPSSAP